MPERINEAGTPLQESPGQSGRMLVRLIDPGVGSSGVYSEEALREAADRRVFARGLPSYIDHPGDSEDRDRARVGRSVRDLAGVLTEDARWDGTGLVAEMQVFTPYRDLISEMKDHIGLSIRAMAEMETREYQGRPARHITSIVEAQSVDFVTRAGRGGKVLALLESAAPTFDAADMAATFGVADDLPDVPVTPAGQPPTQESQEDTMPQIEEGRLAQLEEAAGRVLTLEAERDAEKARADKAEQAMAEASARQSARPAVIAKVAESKTLGPRTQARLVESIVAALPVADGKVDDQALTDTVKSAVEAAEAEAADYVRQGSTVGPLFGSLGSAQESGQPGEYDPDAAATRRARVFGYQPVKGA